MDQFKKTLTEIQEVGDKILKEINYDDYTHYAVDIEYIIESHFNIRIESAPLKWYRGVEGYPSLNGRKIYVDVNLMNEDNQERRYRFTLAEELAHIILHSDIWKDVETVDEWVQKWSNIPESDDRYLNINAKELAGVILMPKNYFINRAIQLRDKFIAENSFFPLENVQTESVIRYSVIRSLMNDFNVSQKPCEIRLERIERAFDKSLFSMELNPKYLKKRKR